MDDGETLDISEHGHESWAWYEVIDSSGDIVVPWTNTKTLGQDQFSGTDFQPLSTTLNSLSLSMWSCALITVFLYKSTRTSNFWTELKAAILVLSVSGGHGCQARVVIPTQLPPKTSSKVVQLAVFTEFTNKNNTPVCKSCKSNSAAYQAVLQTATIVCSKHLAYTIFAVAQKAAKWKQPQKTATWG